MTTTKSGPMRFTPDDYIGYHTRRLGITVGDINVAPNVIITWFDGVLQFLSREIDGQPLPHAPFRHALTGSYHGVPITIVRCPIGAPGTISHMEELIACGAKRFIGVGAAGSLQPVNPVGSLLIPDGCVREEGTSHGYLPAHVDVHAHPTLKEKLAALAGVLASSNVNVAVGAHWTVDAIYCESVADIEQHQSAGILGVDMETSAMYALGMVRHVEVANVLAVSDELWHAWNPAFGTEELEAALDCASHAALKTLRDTGDAVAGA